MVPRNALSAERILNQVLDQPLYRLKMALYLGTALTSAKWHESRGNTNREIPSGPPAMKKVEKLEDDQELSWLFLRI